MRLIDADALEERVCGELDKIISTAYFSLQKDAARIRQGIVLAIESEPAVDAEPVRHGRWIHTTREDSDWGGTFHRYTCSACNWPMGENPTRWGLFCTGCGAKMDLEDE